MTVGAGLPLRDDAVLLAEERHIGAGDRLPVRESADGGKRLATILFGNGRIHAKVGERESGLFRQRRTTPAPPVAPAGVGFDLKAVEAGCAVGENVVQFQHPVGRLVIGWRQMDLRFRHLGHALLGLPRAQIVVVEVVLKRLANAHGEICDKPRFVWET